MGDKMTLEYLEGDDDGWSQVVGGHDWVVFGTRHELLCGQLSSDKRLFYWKGTLITDHEWEPCSGSSRCQIDIYDGDLGLTLGSSDSHGEEYVFLCRMKVMM